MSGGYPPKSSSSAGNLTEKLETIWFCKLTGNSVAAAMYYTPVYQMSTKKAVNPLCRRRLTASHILGRLPDVYQFYFFTSKAPALTDFLLGFATFYPRVRGVTQACFWQKVKKSQNIWSKRRTLLRKCWRSTVYHNWNGVLVLIKSRPLSGRKIL